MSWHTTRVSWERTCKSSGMRSRLTYFLSSLSFLLRLLLSPFSSVIACPFPSILSSFLFLLRFITSFFVISSSSCFLSLLFFIIFVFFHFLFPLTSHLFFRLNLFPHLLFLPLPFLFNFPPSFFSLCLPLHLLFFLLSPLTFTRAGERGTASTKPCQLVTPLSRRGLCEMRGQ